MSRNYLISDLQQTSILINDLIHKFFSGRDITIAKIIKLIFSLLFVSTTIYSQNQNSLTKFPGVNTGEAIKFERLTIEHGLASSRVHGILEDSQGFMWFATDNGLHKYDGNKFIIYKSQQNNPLSISNVYCISLLEDFEGKIWIGTYSGGLNKFDPQTERFTRYLHDPEDSLSLSNNYVMSISTSNLDSGKTLWLGTFSGLSKLDLETNTFSRYFKDENKIYGGKSTITSSFVNDDGVLWVSTPDGLYKYDHETNEFNQFSNIGGMRTFYQDHSGYLWIGTFKDGLYKFDPTTKTFDYYKSNKDDPSTLSDNHILTIFEDNKDNLWIGTFNGLNLMNKQDGTFTQLYNHPDDPTSLSHNYIHNIYQKQNGPIWISTLNGGINKFSLNQNRFLNYKLSSKNKDTSGFESVKTIYLAPSVDESIIWQGTWGSGLFKFDIKKNELSQYYDRTNQKSNFIRSIHPDPLNKNRLWIGTWGSGIHNFDKDKKIFPNRIIMGLLNAIYTIVQDHWRNVFVGCSEGLYIFQAAKNNFYKINDNFVTVICEETPGELWLGTYGQGLIKLLYSIDSKGKIDTNFEYYKSDENDPHSLSNNTINCIYIDEDNVLWLGTKGGGLNRYDPDKDNFSHFTVENGLPSNVIQAILEDNYGNLWLSTQNGISKFNPNALTFRTYDRNDGLLSNEFKSPASFKDNTGKMYFGSSKGLSIFHPDSLFDNPHIPPVVLTDFQIFNKSIRPGKNSPLKKSISLVDTITLAHDQDVFSFEFAALDYAAPNKNKYLYKMEGIDPDWVATDVSRRFATYTHLDPGEYVFRVKGSNNDGIWNEKGSSIRIIIMPPWWRTNFAYAFYILIAIGLVYIFRRYELNRQQLKHNFELEHVEAEKLKEVDSMKSRFFANISHEFRTPLTLIKGPVKQMISGEFMGNVKEQYKMILRNSDRLLTLINQILDLSKLESGRMTLQVVKTDVAKYLKGLVFSFTSLAERKKITLKFKAHEKSITSYIDCDKLDKIIVNLLSNAFKFTPENGEIVVTVEMTQPPLSPFSKGEKIMSPLSRGDTGGCEENDTQFQIPNSDFVKITITNTGPAIPQDKLDKIFDRFYQADTTYKKDSESSGIGLALTKELVELHHGTINVQSTCMEKHPLKSSFSKKDLFYTTFTVLLPLGIEHYTDAEILEETLQEVSNKEPLSSTEPESSIEHSRQKTSSSSRHIGVKSSRISQASSIQKPASSILIVEDNPDVTTYISGFLETDYNLSTAENGKAGWKKALEKYPDLIISDVMMPEMDGFELCKKLKSDERTSHIPVILLTAKADLESKIEGLEFGADDYISKPFEADELKVRSKNLIEQRRKLREKFAKIADFQPADIAATSMDEQFLKRFMTVFESHISESEFSTDKIAKEVGMSRSNLNRKLKALTNQSTHEFIRTLRLKRAAQLLKKSVGSVAEIAYQVGYNNTSHFAKAFREQFGQSPGAFSSKTK